MMHDKFENNDDMHTILYDSHEMYPLLVDLCQLQSLTFTFPEEKFDDKSELNKTREEFSKPFAGGEFVYRSLKRCCCRRCVPFP